MSEARRRPAGFARRTLPNLIAVARREFMYRIRTRAFRATTALLVVGGVALASAPTIFTWLDRGSAGERIEVIGGDVAPQLNPAATLQVVLNAALVGPSIPGQQSGPSKFTVVDATDLEAARKDVIDGTSSAVLALSRAANGDLQFDLYSKGSAVNRSNQLIHQAALYLVANDRLARAGATIDVGALNAPFTFNFKAPDPNGPAPQNPADNPGAFLTGFGLSIAIFMAILLYGQWIAYSVAEEKNSRVMEIVLAAATPFQLLAGKVIGVGALALLQYVIVSVPMLLAIVFQGRISELILGAPADAGAGGAAAGLDLTSGLSIGMVATFGVMLVLGFAVYASLYAGAASLVSRQEDINQIVAPLTIVSVVGYLVSTYAGTGLIPLDSPLVIVLSYIPLFSPYLMLTRLSTGTAEPIEVVVAIVLLLLTIPVALWIAARLYRSGVLMYGQSPSPRTLWKALRAG